MVSFRERYRWQPLAAVAVGLGMLLAGIGSAGAVAGESAAASKVKGVDIDDFAFKPATLKVAKGAQVSFSNLSTVTHTATRDGAFDTGRIKPGKSVTVRFKQRGAFPYRCLIHPSMHGKIVVE